eukprot:6817853-Pyramimonas_sp.AAC.1
MLNAALDMPAERFAERRRERECGMRLDNGTRASLVPLRTTSAFPQRRQTCFRTGRKNGCLFCKKT